MPNVIDLAEYVTEIAEYAQMLEEAAQYEQEWPQLPTPLSQIVGLSDVSGLLKKLGNASLSTNSKMESSEYVLVPRKPAWDDISTLEAPKYATNIRKKVNASGVNLEKQQTAVQICRSKRETTAQFLRSLNLKQIPFHWLDHKYIISENLQRALRLLISDPPMNFIVQSPQNTGKASAMIISMLHRLDVTKKYPQVLCLFPTVDLGSLIEMELFWPYSPAIEIKCMYSKKPDPENPVDSEGAVDPDKKLTQQVLLGTPNEILKLSLKSRVLDLNKICLFLVSNAEELISTQCDQNETLKIYENLNPSCQVAFFSDTYEQEYMDYVEHIVEDPVILKKILH